MRSLLFASFVLLANSSIAAQTTWHVQGNGCGTPGSGTEENPFCTIQEAVDAAADGDTVIVRAGVYPEDVVVPGIRLAILGQSGAEHPVVGGPDSPSSINTSPGSIVHLEDLTLTGGHGGLSCINGTATIIRCSFVDSYGTSGGGSLLSGGGIWAEDSDIAVIECSFERTTAGGAGGAIAVVNTRLLIEDCEFQGSGFDAPSYIGGALWLLDSQVNIARSTFRDYIVFDSGSAIWASGGEFHLQDCLFEDNWVGDYAGAVALWDTDASIRGCAFLHNRSSSGWGGAIYLAVEPEFDVVIEGCSFERNEAAEGGAICVRRGFASISDCTFSANLAWRVSFWERGQGGALFVGGFPGVPRGMAFASAAHCVFVGNAADGNPFVNAGRGGAVFGPVALSNCTLYGNSVSAFAAPDKPTGGAAAGKATLENCIVWANTPDQLERSTPATWSDIQQAWPSLGNLDLDPRFWNSESGDLTLLPSSPCIDAGDPTLLDKDGSRLDIGAHPFEPRDDSVRRHQPASTGLAPARR